MALFKVNKGSNTQRLTNVNYTENGGYIPPKDGYCYFDTSTGLFFIDAENSSGNVIRAPINANKAISDVNGNQIDTTYETQASVTNKLKDKLSKSSNNVLNDGVSIKLTKFANRTLTITGNDITADMSNVTGGWAGSFASVIDPAKDSTTMLGWYGGANGLTHIYMGGTYSDPYMKMTKDGQFHFKYTPKVGAINISLEGHTHKGEDIEELISINEINQICGMNQTI